ncbi:hypothetical protein HanLR1_Chr05g0186851 [Helianthus annuus]|nr:hypothetical protein HanLR1_Chr05g0186851 [Helianthus annuus]
MGVAPSLPAAPTVYGGGGLRRCEGCYPVVVDGYDLLWRRLIVVFCGFVCAFIVIIAGDIHVGTLFRHDGLYVLSVREGCAHSCIGCTNLWVLKPISLFVDLQVTFSVDLSSPPPLLLVVAVSTALPLPPPMALMWLYNFVLKAKGIH